MNNQQILKKAKQTKYNHTNWYRWENKNVYEAIKYFVDSGDFYIDLKNIINSPSQIGYKPSSKSITKEKLIKHCIDNFEEQWKNLRIRYAGSEGGSDKGKLKLKTFLILDNATSKDKSRLMKIAKSPTTQKKLEKYYWIVCMNSLAVDMPNLSKHERKHVAELNGMMVTDDIRFYRATKNNPAFKVGINKNYEARVESLFDIMNDIDGSEPGENLKISTNGWTNVVVYLKNSKGKFDKYILINHRELIRKLGND